MSSRRGLKRRKCGHKKKLSKQEAIEVAKKRRMQPYNCKYCNHWHIGHANGTKQIRMAMRVDMLLKNAK